MTVPDHEFRGGVPPDDRASADIARQDDAALIARIRMGDEAAFGTLLHAYFQRLTRFACVVGGASDLADDVVQTIFTELWVNRAALPPIHFVSSYLFRLVRNRAVDERRARRIRVRHWEQMEAAAAIAPITVVSPEGMILEHAALEAALRRLSEQRQLALRLRYIDQLTHEEIGEVLEISTDAAKKLVSRAVDDLRKIFGVSR